MLLYSAYQSASTITRLQLSVVAGSTALVDQVVPGFAQSPWGRHLTAAHETLSGCVLSHVRPDFAIDGAEEVVVDSTPFADLVRFVPVDGHHPRGTGRPPVLVVAPLSGHFSTLVRNTVRVLLADHDVYLTDWRNARDVAVTNGRFGLDEYVDHVIRFLQTMGEGAHVLAVCQSCVPALSATAVMSEAGDAATPRSLILMAGPIDTRVNPTEVNDFATSRSLAWFERNVITTVPLPHRGVLRRVYPGFLQVAAFMSMNPKRHLGSQLDIYRNLARGDRDAASPVQTFYDEYFAVLDMAAEFYLETVDRVFQRHELATGEMRHHGRRVDPAAIRSTALLTVEGERDDICSIGQTVAAHDLCTNVRPARRGHHLQPHVGHYGVFSGRRWENEIYPEVRAFIRSNG
ncbi:MAG: polyhydroxyalkanoate depolymerase [Acidimicrobiales bacterium]|nr:polyhydroxyalkanoate depolymerase [Acidimicrobiales bacterium]